MVLLLGRRTLGDVKVLQQASGQIIDPAMDPDILAFTSSLRPGIGNSMSFGEISDLGLDVLLDQNGHSFLVGDGRELEGSRESGQRVKPTVQGGINGQGCDRRDRAVERQVGRLSGPETSSSTSALCMSDNNNYRVEKRTKMVGMMIEQLKKKASTVFNTEIIDGISEDR